jgi:hypothetical protein
VSDHWLANAPPVGPDQPRRAAGTMDAVRLVSPLPSERLGGFSSWRTLPFALLVLLLLGWLEQSMLMSRPPSRTTPLDTSISSTAVRSQVPDAVTLHPVKPLQVRLRDAAEGAAADTRAFPASDDTPLSAADLAAVFYIWATGNRTDSTQPDLPEAVSFTRLFSDPEHYRGRVVRVSGWLRRVDPLPLPPNPLGLASAWQVWLEPTAEPFGPYVVWLQDLPASFDDERSQNQHVEVVGHFLKRLAYEAMDRTRAAPAIVAIALTERPSQPEGDWFGTIMLATIVLLLAVMLPLAWVAADRGSRNDQSLTAPDFSLTETARTMPVDRPPATPGIP